MTRTLDLRRAVRRNPLPPVDLGDASIEELAAARFNWRERMVSEHASARVFGALVAPMMRAGLPADEPRRVVDMARQELEHGLLCAQALTALGGEAVAEFPRLDPIPEHADARTPLEAVLRNAISVGCCSETVAVALVGTERELAGPPPLRAILDRILADEIKHARFGWRLVERYAPELDAASKASLDEYLVDVFAHQLAFHGAFLEMPNAGPAGVAIGAPNGQSNFLVFVETMTTVIVPGLERAGLAARAAWEGVTPSRPSPPEAEDRSGAPGWSPSRRGSSEPAAEARTP